mmetsp:Transcript_41499/g.69175  ORF Transcript_41499/g.69175 Transcript_41499/m.69175 type:complete len:85 (+) Transcript_41499:557-811(+)
MVEHVVKFFIVPNFFGGPPAPPPPPPTQSHPMLQSAVQTLRDALLLCGCGGTVGGNGSNMEEMSTELGNMLDRMLTVLNNESKA